MFNLRLKYAVVLTAFAILIALPAFSEEPPKATAQTSATVQASTPVDATVPVVWNLACQLAGGTEFPNGFKVTNNGATKVPKGTKLEWTANTIVDVVTLPADLLPGTSHTFIGVNAGIPAGSQCTMKVKQLPPTLKPFAGRIATPTVKPVAATLAVKLGCVAQGSPAEFPDDLVLTNKGVGTVKKGTVVHWVFPGTSRNGDYTLLADLGVGSTVMVSGAVPGGVGAGTQCTATKK